MTPFAEDELSESWDVVSKEHEMEIASMKICEIPAGIYIARAFKTIDDTYDWFVGEINRKARAAKAQASK